MKVNYKSNSDFKYIEDYLLDSKFGVIVNNVGFQQIAPSTLYPPRCHPKGYYFNSRFGRKLSEYQLVYITQGSGELQIEGEQYKIGKGDVFIVYPNQWHTYTPNYRSGWNEYFIGFSGMLADIWIENSFLANDKQLFNIGLNEDLVRLFKRAIVLAKYSNCTSNLHLSSMVHHFLGLLIFEYNNEGLISKYDMQVIEKSKIIMNENINNYLCMERLSDELNISYSTFRKNFKQITGFSPKQYFLELKLNKAKQLLLETAFSIKEIGIQLGFSSSEHFSTTFNKKNGFAPQKFRVLCRPS